MIFALTIIAIVVLFVAGIGNSYSAFIQADASEEMKAFDEMSKLSREALQNMKENGYAPEDAKFFRLLEYRVKNEKASRDVLLRIIQRNICMGRSSTR